MWISCVLLVALLPQESFSFTTPIPKRFAKRSLVRVAYTPDESSSSNSNSGSEGQMSDADLFADLFKRQNEIEKNAGTISNRWCTADFDTFVGLSIDDDWIRRVDMGRWPYIAIGSASGRVHVADVSTKTVLASSIEAHAQMGGDDEALSLLHGAYDGGGVLDIAMYEDIVVSAGREGGIKIWKMDVKHRTLVSQGELSSLDGVQVTSLTFDEQGSLWVGGFDGTVRRFDINERNSGSSRKQLKISLFFSVFLNCPILSVATNTDIGLTVCGLADGSVSLISSSSGKELQSWKPFANTCARSVAILEGENAYTYHVVCGSTDGTMYMRQLTIDTHTLEISNYEPFRYDKAPERITPSHTAPVVSIAGRKGGLLVTGAHDGSLRVWDCRARKREGTRSLYHLVGYKVWLGSVCIDDEGLRLLSDGSDNTIIVHDFSDSNHDFSDY